MMKNWILLGALAMLLNTGFVQSKPSAQPKPGSQPSATKKQPAKPVQPKQATSKTPKVPPLPKSDLTVATVNGEKITAGQLAEASYEWFGANTIEELILERVVNQEANKQGIKLSQAELNDRFNTSLQNAERQVPPGMSLEDFLRRSQFPRSRLYARTRTQLLAEKLVEKTMNLDDFVQYRQIVIRVQGNNPEEQETNTAAAEAKAKEAYDKIKEGLQFEEAVKTYSDDAFTKDQGGLVPFQKREFLLPDIKDRLAKMKTGEVSEPFRTMQGFMVIRFEKTGKQGTPEEQKQLREQGVRMEMGNYVRELQNKAKITNNIVKPYDAQAAATQPTRPTPVRPQPPRTPQPQPNPDKPQSNPDK
jgi:foldase protein PrsA